MLPERFDLTYIDEDGQPAAPDGDPPRDLRLAGAVHRRPGGALRRARSRSGCAPVQAVVIPIADRHVEPARELAAELRAAGVRFVEVDASDNRMQNKIRLAQGQKVPYMLILGDREVEARTASVRRRDGSQGAGASAWADLAARLGEEVRERRLG